MSVSLVLSSPLGPLTLTEDHGALTSLRFGAFSDTPGETPLLRRAAGQLEEYFAGAHRSFDLPLDPAGTPFQRQVWQALATVPYGETCTYGQLAAAVGRPGGPRAVGLACNRNPLPLFLPCHRVVGADGALVGYSDGLEKKIALLTLEGVHLVPSPARCPKGVENPGNPQNLIVFR